MNIFQAVYPVERNGRVFLLHWKNRYDPGTAMMLAMGATAAGTGMQISGSLRQGREAEAIAKQRAAVDLANANAVEKAAREEAVVRAEGTRRLLASQLSTAAAGGIRINEGVPLVIAADTRRIAARETGFVLDRAEAEAEQFRQNAAIERAAGKQAKKRARFSALMAGLQGGIAIGSMGYASGGTRIPANQGGAPIRPTNHLGNMYA